MGGSNSQEKENVVVIPPEEVDRRVREFLKNVKVQEGYPDLTKDFIGVFDMATQKNHYVLSELLPNPKKYDTKGHHRARHAMVLYKLTGSWPSDYSHNRYFGWAWIGSGVMVASCTLNTAKGWNPKYADGKLKTFMEDLLTTKQLKMLHDNAGELGCDQVHNLTGEGSDIMKLCEDTELILQVDAAIQGELEKAWKEAGVDVEEMKKKNPGSHEAFLGLMGLGDSVKQRKEIKKEIQKHHVR